MLGTRSQDKGATPAPGHKCIPCRVIFDIKMDFTRKARIVAGGHLTNPPTSITYSSVVSQEMVRIAFVLAALNDLDILAADIGNEYLNAFFAEKVYTVTGPKFGDEAGRIAVTVRALYGLKSSGAAWHAYFAQSLHDLGFLSCKSDPDMWRRPAIKADGTKYYEYVLVYVDDLLILSKHPNTILQSLADEHNYRLKDVGSPTPYLGALIGKKQFTDADLWFISAEAYLNKALDTIEEHFGKLDTLFKCKLNTPAPTNFHPEVDDSDFLDDVGTTLYQSYIGILLGD
jgi:Reverse transcriptase (RNA-dependent DNA polymerase)